MAVFLTPMLAYFGVENFFVRWCLGPVLAVMKVIIVLLVVLLWVQIPTPLILAVTSHAQCWHSPAAVDKFSRTHDCPSCHDDYHLL